MRLPRDVSGHDLSNKLAALGYSITRQTGSHVRLTVVVSKLTSPPPEEVTKTFFAD